jgi:hypothetical protein
MSLVLRQNPESPPAKRHTDHLVMSGGLRVGRIYKREGASRADAQWLSALNGISIGCEAARQAGIAATLEQAQAALKENWDKWLAWADLRELGELHPPRPLEIPLASSDSSI